MSHPETPAPTSPADGPATPPQAGSSTAEGSTGAPPARSRGRQTALDMVRSMVVILACVGGVLLFAPQPDEVDQPQVSDAEAAVAVREAGAALGVLPLLLAPGAGEEPVGDLPAEVVVPLDEEWRLDYARTEQTDEVGTWRVGVLSPDERRVDLEQAVDPTEEWLTRADAGEPGLPEPVEVGGLTWTVQERGDGRTAWTYEDPAGGAGALTTAVSASSGSDDLREVVGAVSAALAR